MSQFKTISSDCLTAEISSIGAALARLWLKGHDTSLVLGLPTPEDYATSQHYIGVIAGPIAGRIAGAKAQVNGTPYKMHANAPPHCLHSGRDGVNSQHWAVSEHRSHAITLTLTLKDGACGLPGTRTLSVQYQIVATTLTLTITTQTDADTLVNAASHAYWTLDDVGDLSTHHLTVATKRTLETDRDLIPTGHITTQAHDFLTPCNPRIATPLDTCFCLADEPIASLHPAMSLHSTRSGLTLDVSTNQTGLVLYSGEHLPQLPAPQNTPIIAPFGALAIETQGWPDAPNHRNFPSIHLQAHDTLKQITQFNLRLP